MKDEENLDHVLDQHLYGGKPVAPLDDTITPYWLSRSCLLSLKRWLYPLSLLTAWKELFELGSAIVAASPWGSLFHSRPFEAVPGE